MPIIRYKTFAAARKDLVRDMVERNSKTGATHSSCDLEDLDARPPSCPKGLYRFKTFADARRFDMECMIRRACLRRVG